MRKDISNPMQIEIEKAFISCFLQDNPKVELLETNINREDFSTEIHQLIYDGILESYKTTGEIDEKLIRKYLHEQKDIDYDEAKGYLNSCYEIEPTSWGATVYANQIRSFSQARQMCAVIEKSYTMLTKQNVPQEEVNEYLLNVLSGISIVNKSSIRCAKDLAEEHYKFLQERANQDSDKLFSCGFPTLNEKFMLFGDSNVVVIKAERGSGKTHLGIHFSMQCAKLSTKHAVFYSLEMNRFQLENRYLACIKNRDSQILQHPGEDDWVWIAEAQGIFSDTNIHISDDADISIDQMYRECKQFTNAGKEIGLIVIDFAEQIAPGKSRKNENREQELSANSRGLRKLANDFRCTVVLLSQVNDEGKERGSRGIGNLADLLMTWKSDNKSDRGNLSSDKNRFGPAFSIDIHIDKATSRMHEIDNRYEPPSRAWSDNVDREEEL